MKRVLIVGSDFSPSSYPPALRIRFFVRHLPDFGWRPTVLTIRPEHYEWSVDPEDERLIPDGLNLIRTHALPVNLTRWLGFGDVGLRSLCHHWLSIRSLVRKHRFDLLLIPGPPFYPIVLGRATYDSFSIPYVVDYIDPWVTDDWRKLPKEHRLPKRAFADRLSRVLEPWALRHVAHITGVSDGTTAPIVQRCPWLKLTDMTEIPYGVEPFDFDYVRRHPRRNRFFRPDDGLFHMCYVGRGGPDLTSALKALFEAIHRALACYPKLFERLRLHFVGTTYAPNANGAYQVLPLAEACGVSGCVTEHPARVPYLEAVQLLLDSHALVVIGSESTHYTASKIFPYILSRRPILAIFHEQSSAVRILHETNAAFSVTFSSTSPPSDKVEQIFESLQEIVSLPKNYEPNTCWDQFEQYTARAMTGRLAKVFDRIVHDAVWNKAN